MSHISIVTPHHDSPQDWIGDFVFLAGATSGAHSNWRQGVIDTITKTIQAPLTIIDPVNHEWDATWSNSINCDRFVRQTRWEITHLAKTNFAVFFFAPDAECSITLLELGWSLAHQHIKRLVICPNQYKYAGNVHLMCDVNNIQVCQEREGMEEWIASQLKQHVVTHEVPTYVATHEIST